MGSVPADQRGVAAGMRGTFFNSGSALSIGIFFSLMIVGLASTLPHDAHLRPGRPGRAGRRRRSRSATCRRSAACSPRSSASTRWPQLLGPSGVLNQLPAANAANLTGKQFFPHLISGPFHHGLVVVFTAAAIMMLIGAAASLIQTKPEAVAPAGPGTGASAAPSVTSVSASANGASASAKGALANGAAVNGAPASANGAAPINAVDAEAANVVAAETTAVDKAR